MSFARTEGRVAKAIETETSKIPSDMFLWAGLGAIGLSLVSQIAGRRDASRFFGQWVPTILIFGLYNKLVKVAGHEKGVTEGL
ncbi:MAG: hypothetical protein HY549_01355 [Elusimicrobia bacterium]|nr:hypothetical protein [Elusimicrobiota bacterium]